MTNFATTRNNYRFSSGKQCICTYKLQNPSISPPTEMDGFVLVGRFPNPSQTQKTLRLRDSMNRYLFQ